MAEIIQTLWFLLWLISIAALLVLCWTLYESFKKKNSKMGVVAPLILPILLVIGSPLYLESISNDYMVFDRYGSYKYTVRPNDIGIIPQGDWDAHFSDSNRVVNSYSMKADPVYAAPPSIGIEASSTNGWVAIITYTGLNSKDDLLARAGKFISLGIQEREQRGAALNDLIRRLVEESSAYPVLQAALNSYTHDGDIGVMSLEEKVALLSSLKPLDRDLRKFGLQIVNVDFQK